MFFWNSLAFSKIQWMLAIWPMVSLPFLNPAWTSGSSRFTYCWSLALRLLSITLLACEMNAIVQYSLISRWWSIRMCTHLLWEAQNYNLLLNNCWQENVQSHQKIPHIQGQRRSPSKMVGGAKSCLESNPIPARAVQRAQTKPVHTRRPHGDWAVPAFERLSVSCGGLGQQWPVAEAGALGAGDLGMA